MCNVTWGLVLYVAMERQREEEKRGEGVRERGRGGRKLKCEMKREGNRK